MTYPPEYPDDGLCGCCGLWHHERDFDHLYGCCSACAGCQSLGHCYEGEDRPENTICCHGTRDTDSYCAWVRRSEMRPATDPPQ